MSRPQRIQYPDTWYHVMNRGRPSTKTAGGRDVEIPASTLLAPDVDGIVGEVCKFYNVSSNDLLLSLVFKIKFLEINLVGCCFSVGFQSTIVNQQSSIL